jgi:hypothetical protein
LHATIEADQVPILLDGHGHMCLIAPDIDLAGILDAWRRTSS